MSKLEVTFLDYLIPFVVTFNNLTNTSCRLTKRNFLTYAMSCDMINSTVQGLIFHLSTFYCNHIKYSVRQLVTSLSVRDRIPVGARFSATVQTGLGAHSASYTMGTVSYPWVKWPGRGVDHPLPISTAVRERVEL
jgi:hypothetical protein